MSDRRTTRESRKAEHPHREHEEHVRHGHHSHNHHPKKKECCSGHPIIFSEGELVIQYTRTSFTIPFALPFCLWGTLYINNNNFGAILAPYLPANVSVVTSIDRNTGNLIFTYTYSITEAQDTIVLTIPQSLISYAEMLESINTNYMKSNYSILTVNSAIGAPYMVNSDIYSLLDYAFIFTKVSALSNTGGSKTRDIVIPRSRMNPQNTQVNIVEMFLRKQDVKPDAVWINSFAYTATIAAFAVPITSSLTIFINQIFDMNKEADKIHDH